MNERQGEEFRRCRRCERPRDGHRLDRAQWHCVLPGQPDLYEPDHSLESNVRIELEILIAATRSGDVRHVRGALHHLYRSVVEAGPQEGSLVDPLRRP